MPQKKKTKLDQIVEEVLSEASNDMVVSKKLTPITKSMVSALRLSWKGNLKVESDAGIYNKKYKGTPEQWASLEATWQTPDFSVRPASLKDAVGCQIYWTSFIHAKNNTPSPRRLRCRIIMSEEIWDELGGKFQKYRASWFFEPKDELKHDFSNIESLASQILKRLQKDVG